MTDAVVVRCRGCGQLNRARMAMGPKCGKCKTSLVGVLVDAVMEAADEVREQRHASLMDRLQRAAGRMGERESKS